MVHFVRILQMATSDACPRILLLKDLQRNRLDARLTQLKPLIIMGKLTERDAVAAACAVQFRLFASVNLRSSKHI